MGAIAYSSTTVAATRQARAGNDITAVYDSFTVAVALLTTDYITFNKCKIPIGATVLEVIISASASLAAASTIKLGDTSDDDRFIASATAFAAGAQDLIRLSLATGFLYTYTAEDYLRLTAVTMTTPTTATVVKACVLYTMQS